MAGGSEDDISEGEDFSLFFLGLVCTELVVLALSQDLSEKHDC